MNNPTPYHIDWRSGAITTVNGQPGKIWIDSNSTRGSRVVTCHLNPATGWAWTEPVFGEYHTLVVLTKEEGKDIYHPLIFDGEKDSDELFHFISNLDPYANDENCYFLGKQFLTEKQKVFLGLETEYLEVKRDLSLAVTEKEFTFTTNRITPNIHDVLNVVNGYSNNVMFKEFGDFKIKILNNLGQIYYQIEGGWENYLKALKLYKLELVQNSQKDLMKEDLLEEVKAITQLPISAKKAAEYVPMVKTPTLSVRKGDTISFTYDDTELKGVIIKYPDNKNIVIQCPHNFVCTISKEQIIAII